MDRRAFLAGFTVAPFVQAKPPDNTEIWATVRGLPLETLPDYLTDPGQWFLRGNGTAGFVIQNRTSATIPAGTPMYYTPDGRGVTVRFHQSSFSSVDPIKD